MKNFMILLLAMMAFSCKKEKMPEGLIQSIDSYLNVVRSGNPVISYPRNLKFNYFVSGQIKSFRDLIISGGPPLENSYTINYMADGRVKNVMKDGTLVQECAWSDDKNVTIYLPDSGSPDTKYIISYNDDGSLKTKEKFLGLDISYYKLFYYWDQGNIVKIENYYDGRLIDAEIYSYTEIPNPLTFIPRGLVYLDGYLRTETKFSKNNVESGYTAYFNYQGSEYQRYQHIWTYTYGLDQRLESIYFELDIPQTGMLSNYHSETYKIHYDK